MGRQILESLTFKIYKKVNHTRLETVAPLPQYKLWGRMIVILVKNNFRETYSV